MQPSQLPGPGLAAGATSRPTSALSSISSRGVAGIGIGGERPPSMVFYANAVSWRPAGTEPMAAMHFVVLALLAAVGYPKSTCSRAMHW
jgi:hypothetical protein